jgi:hypothetical protein
MPTVTNAANNRRCHDCRCHDDRCGRYHHDRPSIRLTSSIRSTVKAVAASALSIGVMDTGE